MKKLNYTTRAFFEESSSEDTMFIRKLIKTLNIQTTLEIPCANGRNLSVIGDVVSSAFFADINPNMVKVVRNKIIYEKKKNCKALILDICDLSDTPFEVDAILIMQQSFQMLTAESGRKALRNLLNSRCHYIVIDIYDFFCDAPDLPKFLTVDNTFADRKNKKWIRHSSISGSNDNLVYITHEYESSKEVCYAKVSLFNYSRNEFKLLCEECGHVILDYYTDYSFGKNPDFGRTIFVIEKKKVVNHGQSTK
jgi:hypothetical protein